MFIEEGLDFDWFFLDKNEKIVFVASGGGKIPSQISNDHDYNLSQYFNSIPNISNKFIINEKLKQILGIDNIDKVNAAISYFISLSKKGIYCFDKTVLNNNSDTNYHLVAKPEQLLNLGSLPRYIQVELKKVVFDIDIEKVEKINIKDYLY